MKRVFNFSAGPSMLPLEVLEKAGVEIMDADDTGQSVMEMSHRSKDYKPIIERTESLLRELMDIPMNYRVLFLQGGASLQFAMVPLNLAGVEQGVPRKKADYVDTGIWADKAIKEAEKYIDVDVVASSRNKGYVYIPDAPPPQKNVAFYHITLNNTIIGTKWSKLPETESSPLVADASSCILSEPLDVSRFGVIYAGAQKNLGPAGTTVVIIREDLIGNVPSWVPTMLRYDVHVKDGSMYNTPPCYGIYIIGLVLEWVKEQGGVEVMAQRNREKATLFYDYLDNSKVFLSPIEKPFRSLMNIPFLMGVPFVYHSSDEKSSLEKRFVQEAATEGLVNLAGHRLVGGMRASIYNAMPIEGVKALIGFMERFEKNIRN
ncbi:MAG: 3-phosphoserine/phosphohydroxythreonine transaminase [Treponema sp.]|nr:3-phosphoserine/phosphohydroxythreonine transaminase [Treponema sp.]